MAKAITFFVLPVGLVVALAIAALAVLGAQTAVTVTAIEVQAAQETLVLPQLNTIPLTKHAVTTHAWQRWNPAQIIELMAGKGCWPMQTYYCTAGRNPPTLKVTCPINPLAPILWVELTIGLRDPGAPVIVTGYPINYARLQAALQRDSCYPVAVLWR